MLDTTSADDPYEARFQKIEGDVQGIRTDITSINTCMGTMTGDIISALRADRAAERPAEASSGPEPSTGTQPAFRTTTTPSASPSYMFMRRPTDISFDMGPAPVDAWVVVKEGDDGRQRRAVNPACAQYCILSIVRANFQKYDLYSAPIARALPRYIVPFFRFFKAGKCFKTMLFPVSCVSQKSLAFQKHSLLLIQPKTHAKALSERSEKCATVQVLRDKNRVGVFALLIRTWGYKPKTPSHSVRYAARYSFVVRTEPSRGNTL